MFPRSFRKACPEAVRGEGCFVFTADNRRILDASGGAAVVSIGHGVASVAQAMAEQAGTLAYAHSSQFVTRAAAELAHRLLALAPPNFRDSEEGPGRVFLTCGGSEAAETALKICRQYFLERGELARTQFVSRSQSYHGATLGALALSGNVKRRTPFSAALAGLEPHRSVLLLPMSARFALSAMWCSVRGRSRDADRGRSAARMLPAFSLSLVSGATLGAVAPPPEYLPRIAEICRRHGILLVADEVMTGMGRTGKNFAVEHWGVEADIILVGKGVASGYAPLGAAIVTGRVAAAIEKGSGAFLHGFTYSAHPVCAAAGLAVLDYIAEHDLFAPVAAKGEELRRSLTPLRELPMVGDVRGIGLLLGIEFVRDAPTREPFPASASIASRVYEAALRRGVLTYPIQGCADGSRGDHILIAPPFIISSDEIRFLSTALHDAIDEVYQECSATTK